jgi:hypothetical protein
MRNQQDERLACKCEACGQTRTLTISEVIKAFFELRSPDTVDKKLWEWFFMSVESQEMNGWSGADRSNFTLFYKDLADFFQKLSLLTQKTCSHEK